MKALFLGTSLDFFTETGILATMDNVSIHRKEKRTLAIVLGETVKRIITDYKEKHPWDKHSCQSIADKADSCRTTISDIMRGRIKNLSLKNAHKIGKALDGPESFDDFISLVKEENPDDMELIYDKIPWMRNYCLKSGDYENLLATPVICS